MPRLKKNAYLEISLEGVGSVGSHRSRQIREFFIKQGIAPNQWVLSQTRKRFKTCAYLNSYLKAEKIKKAFLSWRPVGLRWKSRILEVSDWRDKWMIDYHTQRLASKFLLIPGWERAKGKETKRKPIYLEPGSAFGSGTHETTRLVVKCMEPLEGRFKRFLDIGTGTGILSVVASRLGAEVIEGFDHDGAAVKTARRNLIRNGFKKSRFIKKDLAVFKTKKHFDLVCANVRSGALNRFQKKIASCVSKGGYLVLSGILKSDLKEFMQEFKPQSLKTQKIIKSRRWCAVIYKKID